MGKETNIEWCDSTINGSSGCDGCELWVPGKGGPCYAGNLHENRWAKSLALTHPEHYAASFDVVKMIPGRFAQAARWSDLRGVERPGKPWLNGRPRHIFIGDMGDFLSRDVTDDFLREELLGAVRSPEGRRHVWLWLTKRPERLARLSHEWDGLPDNVVAMTSVTNARTATVRIPWLLKTRCRWKGLSMEPLWSDVNLDWALHRNKKSRVCPLCLYATNRMEESLCPNDQTPLGDDIAVDWVIVGGESGRNAAPMEPGWPRALRDQCLEAGVPFFFKQWDGKASRGRRLEGFEWNELPAVEALEAMAV